MITHRDFTGCTQSPTEQYTKLKRPPGATSPFKMCIRDRLGSYGLKAHIIDYVKQLSPEFIEKECLSEAFDSEIVDCINT